jgi:hypothetical protein
MSWTFLDNRLDAPFGTVVSFSNSSFEFPTFAGTSLVEFRGDGSIVAPTIGDASPDGYRWATIAGNAHVIVDGTVEVAAVVRAQATSIGALATSVVVANTHYVPGLVLAAGGQTFRAVPSVESTSLFIGAPEDATTIFFDAESTIDLGYVSILIYLATLFGLTATRISSSLFVRLRSLRTLRSIRERSEAADGFLHPGSSDCTQHPPSQRNESAALILRNM